MEFGLKFRVDGRTMPLASVATKMISDVPMGKCALQRLRKQPQNLCVCAGPSGVKNQDVGNNSVSEP